jgi:hypothetical protein
MKGSNPAIVKKVRDLVLLKSKFYGHFDKVFGVLVEVRLAFDLVAML